MEKLSEILKNPRRSIDVWCTILGESEVDGVDDEGLILISAKKSNGHISKITLLPDGRLVPDGEVLIYPRRDLRSWSGWKEVLFKEGDFISTKQGLRFITDISNRRCFNEYGELVWFILGDGQTRWATEEEIREFIYTLRAHNKRLDTERMTVSDIKEERCEEPSEIEEDVCCSEIEEDVCCKPNNPYYGADTDTPAVGKDMYEGVTDAVKKIVEKTATESQAAIINVILEDIISDRKEELRQIHKRERLHGITGIDEAIIYGGLTELDIIREKLIVLKGKIENGKRE